MTTRFLQMKPFALALSVAFLAIAVPVTAAEQTRETYVAQVEPICKVNKEASDRHLKGVKNLVKNDKLSQAAQRFTKAANALEKAHEQLGDVPQPAADATRLGKWLTGIKGEVSLMRRIASKLKAGEKGKGTSLAVKLQNNATQTNNLVIVFQFNYCRIDPSQYT